MVSALAEETSLLMTLVTMLAAPPYSADAAARIVGGALADEGAPQIPAAALATEDAELIHRLLGRGIAVRVSLTGYEYEAIIPFVPLTLDLPAFTTTLRREHMLSSGNSVCS